MLQKSSLLQRLTLIFKTSQRNYRKLPVTKLLTGIRSDTLSHYQLLKIHRRPPFMLPFPEHLFHRRRRKHSNCGTKHLDLFSSNVIWANKN